MPRLLYDRRPRDPAVKRGRRRSTERCASRTSCTVAASSSPRTSATSATGPPARTRTPSPCPAPATGTTPPPAPAPRCANGGAPTAPSPRHGRATGPHSVRRGATPARPKPLRRRYGTSRTTLTPSPRSWPRRDRSTDSATPTATACAAPRCRTGGGDPRRRSGSLRTTRNPRRQRRQLKKTHVKGNAFEAAVSAANPTASTCLHGPRPPRYLAHQRQVQPGTSSRTRSGKLKAQERPRPVSGQADHRCPMSRWIGRPVRPVQARGSIVVRRAGRRRVHRIAGS